MVGERKERAVIRLPSPSRSIYIYIYCGRSLGLRQERKCRKWKWIFENPYALALPCRLFLFAARSRAAAQGVPPELLKFRFGLTAWSVEVAD